MGHQLGVTARLMFPDRKNAGRVGSVANVQDGLSTPGNYDSEGDMDARLTTINGTLYSAANLATMTQNDKIFALRNNDDATSL